jgi:hypothetical protein
VVVHIIVLLQMVMSGQCFKHDLILDRVVIVRRSERQFKNLTGVARDPFFDESLDLYMFCWHLIVVIESVV